MNQSLKILFALLLTLQIAFFTKAQDSTLVPTLAIPTLVPARELTAPLDALATESALADIISSGVLRAGVLYNDPPYSEFTLQGEVRGFDIELLNLIADAWGSEIEFLQVTRLNAVDKLNSGAVHMVASALIHYRDLDRHVEFTQTYLQGKQAMMVSADSAYSTPAELAGRSIGYVLGTRTEKALGLWLAGIDASVTLNQYLNLDRAFAALSRGEVDALIAEEQDLLRVTGDYANMVRILDEAIVTEPHAFAIRRQDAPMRHLLNRSIQRLTMDRQLEVLVSEYFPGESVPLDVISLWDGIGEEVKPAQFSAQIAYPTRYAIPRIFESGVLRVGGISLESGSTAGIRKLAELNRAMVNALAGRWGLSVEIIPSSLDEAVELLKSGAVDIIVGAMPDWALAGMMDFSAPYLLHGDRLMVPTNAAIQGFNNLRGRWIGVISGDDASRGRAQAWADSINATVRFLEISESGATRSLIEFDNADAVYANSLALVAHLEESPNALRLTDRWYSRSYYAFGLPYNDIDFRLLVDYTIQDFIRDGTLLQLSAPLILSDELPVFDLIPGVSSIAGINLAAF